ISRYCEAKFGSASKSMLSVYREIHKAMTALKTDHARRGPANIYSSELWARIKPHFTEGLSATSHESETHSAVQQFEAQILSIRFMYEMSNPDQNYIQR